MRDDTRLIEDYLPIEAIGEEATREKSARKGNVSTLHLWWARRPLAGCRAIVYGALASMSRFVPNGASDSKKQSLGRANAARFIERLCTSGGEPRVIAEAQRHILEAHAERLSGETGKPVTVEDIEVGRAPRPKVLDMFAGGGAIPLEAIRLGCEAYALDLNPLAHIIQLCTLVYPQKYGKPDPTARGMTGPKNDKSETTWGGLAEEVRYWGEWVLKKLKAEIGDLYPPIPDPAHTKKREPVKDIFGRDEDIPPGYLMPVAYLWTRTVICKKPDCKAVVPLVRQTWLSKKKGRNIALRVIPPKSQKRVRFEVVQSDTEKGLGFDPAGFSKAGNATCPFCGTVGGGRRIRQSPKRHGRIRRAVDGSRHLIGARRRKTVFRWPRGAPSTRFSGYSSTPEEAGRRTRPARAGNADGSMVRRHQSTAKRIDHLPQPLQRPSIARPHDLHPMAPRIATRDAKTRY